MRITVLSDLSTVAHGYKVRANDLMVPREIYEAVLNSFPAVLDETKEFFKQHDKCQCIVIKDFKNQVMETHPEYFGFPPLSIFP